jgi:putative phosphoribosyl transferase
VIVAGRNDPFVDRSDAGRRLATLLLDELPEPAGDIPTVVVGLPRGGVPVAREVAAALHAPLDVIVVRKLGVPIQPELAMGAIGEHGVRVLNDDVVAMAGIDGATIRRVEAAETTELARRVRRYRGDRAGIPLAGARVVVVDDGVATGATAAAACRVARAAGAVQVVLATPVAPPDWIERLGDAADVYLAVATPEAYASGGRHYRRFGQVSDDEVAACLTA